MTYPAEAQDPSAASVRTGLGSTSSNSTDEAVRNLAHDPSKPGLGERFDALMAEMDAAYAERRKHKIGSPLYIAADVMVERVYDKLGALNSEAARTLSPPEGMYRDSHENLRFK